MPESAYCSCTLFKCSNNSLDVLLQLVSFGGLYNLMLNCSYAKLNVYKISSLGIFFNYYFDPMDQ